MVSVNELLLAVSLSGAINILYVALGLGLVIFFHELGHFAVAKWCDVHVERFSIGFGPIVWSTKRGETEYALSAIPFGGYVKMLGQDDMDPSQLSSEEIAEDPRSYSAKPVWKRMSIISAGVIMNILTGVLFFALAFGLGISVSPATFGDIIVGSPAWEAGLQTGDQIKRINGRKVSEFRGIMHGVALTTGDVVLEGKHADGSPFEISITPDEADEGRPLRMIGAAQSYALELRPLPEGQTEYAVTGTPAAAADPAFEPGDEIVALDDTPVTTYRQLVEFFSTHRQETVRVGIQRGKRKETLSVSLAPQQFRTLGLSMDFGQIVAVQQDAPAAREGELSQLRVDDKITQVDGRDVGRDLDPLELPDYFASRHGETVYVSVVRKEGSGDSVTRELEIRPIDRGGWTEPPMRPGQPISIPSLGIAFHVIPTILRVKEDSPAAAAKVPERSLIKSIELLLPKKKGSEGVEPDLAGVEPLKIPFDDDQQNNWAFAFWMLQELPTRTVKLTVSHEEKTETFELTPTARADWFVPSTRGLLLDRAREELKADSFGEAIAMGGRSMRSSMTEVYLTIRRLVSGDISTENMSGPIGIAKVAYATANEGLSALSWFLGFLSINLAVLNFLPIPVLDGGHMVFLMWEGVTRRRPSERVLTAATVAGILFVLGLMGYVVYLDIDRIVG